MTNKETYSPPTEAEVKKHWKAQEPSLFREPGKRDPGLTIANSREEVTGLVQAEVTQGPVPAFKLRSTAAELPDPVARSQGLIRAKTQRGLSAEEFIQRCENVEDLILYNCLYGEMSDSQRNQGLVKLADLLFRKQQEVLKQHELASRREAKATDQMLAAHRLLSKVKPKEGDGI